MHRVLTVVVYVVGMGLVLKSIFMRCQFSLALSRFGKVYAVADPQNNEIVLGRDVLNQFMVTLNGLASAVEISQ